MRGPLKMVRLRLSMPGLFALARARGLTARSVDLGYLVHCELKGLFGDEAPGPFRLEDPRGRWLTVHAYSSRPKHELVDFARAYADPVIAEAWDAESMAEKDLPASWPRRIGFEVRCCPVVRLSKEVRPLVRKPGDREVVAAGAEVDVFLARAWRDPSPLDRETVYREWLAAELSRRGGLGDLRVRVVSMKRTAVLRRTRGAERKGHASERPDVTFAGTAEIEDAAAFADLLARGVGRHRAFGFGMLIPRPPPPPC